MTKKRIPVAPILVLAAMLSLGACSAKPEAQSFGEKITTEGSSVARLGEQWTAGDQFIADGRALAEQGRDRIDDGESLVSKGQGRISKGRGEVAKGERMIAEGERMKREA